MAHTPVSDQIVMHLAAYTLQTGKKVWSVYVGGAAFRHVHREQSRPTYVDLAGVRVSRYTGIPGDTMMYYAGWDSIEKCTLQLPTHREGQRLVTQEQLEEYQAARGELNELRRLLKIKKTGSVVDAVKKLKTDVDAAEQEQQELLAKLGAAR